MIIRNGRTYLTAKEARSEEFLNISPTTLQKIEERYGLQPKLFVGYNRQRFFLKEVIELIRDNPNDPESIARVREQIQELQQKAAE